MASVFSTVRLPSSRAWDPTALLAPDAIDIWGIQATLLPISSMAEYLPAGEAPAERIDAVAPSSIDQRLGHVRRLQPNYRGPVYRGGCGEYALQGGDVLIPRSGQGPALVMTEEMTAYAYSAQFHALHPKSPDLGLWLWAVLSSTRGLRARQAAQAGSITPVLSIAGLLSLAVPSVGDTATLRRLAALAEERCTARLGAEKSSWWSIRSIPADGTWAPRIFMKDPTVLDHGQPLHQLAQVVKGRRPVNPARVPTEGSLPVMEARVVTGSAPRWWSDDKRLPRIKPGDVVVQAVGDRPRASEVQEEYLASDSVLVVRAREGADATTLAHSLTSSLAAELLGALSRGSALRHLSAKDLETFPVQTTDAVSAKTQPGDPTTLISLRDRIDQELECQW